MPVNLSARNLLDDDLDKMVAELLSRHQMPASLQQLEIRTNDKNGESLIVGSGIELSHSLGLTAVAQGVETLDAYDRLGALVCDVVQGHYISRPLAADGFDSWRAAWLDTPVSHRQWHEASHDRVILVIRREAVRRTTERALKPRHVRADKSSMDSHRGAWPLALLALGVLSCAAYVMFAPLNGIGAAWYLATAALGTGMAIAGAWTARPDLDRDATVD